MDSIVAAPPAVLAGGHAFRAIQFHTAALPVSPDAGQRWNTTLIVLAGDCGVFANTFPACANSTWTMYASPKYFCCETGQIAVVGALCVPGDQAVPFSKLATAVCFPLC